MASTPAPEILRPRPLPPGGTVGLAAPAGPVDPERLDAGCAWLEGAGFRVVRQELVRRRGGGLWVEALAAGRPALVLTRSDGTRITLTAQQSYGRTGELRSVSFTQRPDISIRIDRPGAPPELLLFDPKYKLDSEARVAEEEDEGEPAPRGQPRKVDIDKMHAYRDAVRTSSGARIVHHASILFPGDSVVYDEGVGAVGALPGRSAEATFEIARTLSAMSENFSSRASAAREPDESVLAAHPR